MLRAFRKLNEVNDLISRILNAFIFASTLIIVILHFRRDGKWNVGSARYAFRFFTEQSNVLCAFGALAMLLFPSASWSWMLKYIGTAAVSVTMLTVFLFLAPSTGSLTPLISGSGLFLHLITPLLAIISFSFFEKRDMSFAAALAGMLPVVLYGPWYLYKIVYAPEDRRWDDFYGFNKGGHWPVSFAAMVIGTFAVCMGLMALQNI